MKTEDARGPCLVRDQELILMPVLISYYNIDLESGIHISCTFLQTTIISVEKIKRRGEHG